MTQVGSIGVSMLVGQPLPFVGVSVTCTNVLGLQVLQLAVNVVAVPHAECNTHIHTQFVSLLHQL